MVNHSFQGLEVLEAQQKLQHIRACEQALQMLEEELDLFIQKSEINVIELNRGSYHE